MFRLDDLLLLLKRKSLIAFHKIKTCIEIVYQSNVFVYIEPNSLSHHYPMDFTDGLQILMKREVSPASNDMSPFVDFEMMSMYNSGGGTSPGPLQVNVGK